MSTNNEAIPVHQAKYTNFDLDSQPPLNIVDWNPYFPASWRLPSGKELHLNSSAVTRLRSHNDAQDHTSLGVEPYDITRYVSNYETLESGDSLFDLTYDHERFAHAAASPLQATSSDQNFTISPSAEFFEPTTQDTSPQLAEVTFVTPDIKSGRRMGVLTKRNLAAKPGRTQIKDKNKQTLEESFSENPYPTKKTISSLSLATGLVTHSIRVWFNNTRSRKINPPGLHSDDDTVIMESPGSGVQRSIAELSTSNLSETTLVNLNKLSPATSTSSLERYLATSFENEFVSPETIEAALCEQRQRSPPNEEMHAPQLARYTNKRWQGCKSSSSRVPMTARRKLPLRTASSTKDSRSSVSSVRSRSSGTSHKSVDSRGSRKGRKAWMRYSVSRTESQPYPPSRRTMMRKSTPHGPNLGSPIGTQIFQELRHARSTTPFICTWAGCKSSFQYRSEWVRHEEALHYCPYHWICCLPQTSSMRLPRCLKCEECDIPISHLWECHFSSCTAKALDDRTFLREDQLMQHISGVHLRSKKIQRGDPRYQDLRQVLAAWRIRNPLSSPSALHCGFCGLTFDTWEQRNAHVEQHLRQGACRSAWWPGRLSSIPKDQLSSEVLTCPACAETYPDPASFGMFHSFCLTWSCRYLVDFHAAFDTDAWKYTRLPGASAMSSTGCRLCDYRPRSCDTEEAFLHDCESHMSFHALRECEQHVYTDYNEFQTHLVIDHGAEASWVALYLDSWQQTQVVQEEESHDRVSLVTTPAFMVNELWRSEQPDYIFSFIGRAT